MRRNVGFSLTELLITVTVAGLATALVMPSYARLLADQQAAATINELLGSLQLARQSAAFYRATTTVCASRGARCGDDWTTGYLVFVDRNVNGDLDAEDLVLSRSVAAPNNARLRWRSFRLRRFLQFTSRGLTRAENGTFTYCTGRSEPGSVSKVVINTAGRARLVIDANHDGRFDDGSGAATCPAR